MLAGGEGSTCAGSLLFELASRKVSRVIHVRGELTPPTHSYFPSNRARATPGPWAATVPICTRTRTHSPTHQAPGAPPTHPPTIPPPRCSETALDLSILRRELRRSAYFAAEIALDFPPRPPPLPPYLPAFSAVVARPGIPQPDQR